MSEPPFKDHFSDAADAYAAFRPTYPDALYDFLAAGPALRQLAWDCGTGNGQCAVALADRFARVIATDASARQISRAVSAGNVRYRVAPAEDSGIEDAAVDLVTAAQAAHWFDTARFADEVRRVAAPGAWLAVWGYTLARVGPVVDRLLDAFYTGEIGPFWPPERALLDAGYATLDLPIEPAAAPTLEMTARWRAERMLRYLATWSAVRRFEAARGRDPLLELAEPLRRAWGDGEREVRWPLALRAGPVLR